MDLRYRIVEIDLVELGIVAEGEEPACVWIIVDVSYNPAKRVARCWSLEGAKLKAEELEEKYKRQQEEKRKAEQKAEQEEEMDSGPQMR